MKIKKLLWCSFISYLIIIVWLIYFKANIGEWINNTVNFFQNMNFIDKIRYGIIPFEHYKLWKVKAYLLNVLIFIPFFVYLKLLGLKDKKFILLLLILIPILIEVIQLFIPYCGFAGEDIICNMLGMGIGLYLARYILKINDSVINKLTIISLIMLLPIVIYAVSNTIININLYL